MINPRSVTITGTGPAPVAGLTPDHQAAAELDAMARRPDWTTTRRPTRPAGADRREGSGMTHDAEGRVRRLVDNHIRDTEWIEFDDDGVDDLRAVLQALADTRQQLNEARTGANALTVFCRQAGCNDAELGAIFQAYSPDKFADGMPGWLTPQRPASDVERWPPTAPEAGDQ